MSSLSLQKQNLLKRQRRELESLKKTYMQELPHISLNHYTWSRKFVESENKMNLMSAANQIGKSVALIRRNIFNCTEPHAWEKFYGKKPTQLWYFYPDEGTLLREFETKWIHLLPQGLMAKSPQYGWKPLKHKGKFRGVQFNTGVPLFFFQYSQSATHMQASTVNEVSCDEEPPLELYDELIMRLLRTNGTFNAVFTPTLNQQFWADAIETNRILPQAFKQQISMYDCLEFEDGTTNPDITEVKIKEVIAKCSNEDEVNRRVHGKFPKYATTQDRNYYAFDLEKHYIKPHATTNWFNVVVCDYGSGKEAANKRRHPSAVLVLAIKPDYTEGRVIYAWRGDDTETTAGDLYDKYVELTRDLRITQRVYDPGQPDFGTIADRMGDGFQKAQKDRKSGEELVNTLFKYDMIKIFAYDLEEETDVIEIQRRQTQKLVAEALNFRAPKSIDKKEGDDLLDCLRYGCKAVVWDFTHAVEPKNKEQIEKRSRPKTSEEIAEEQITLRRGEMIDIDKEIDDWGQLERDFAEWNEEYG